MLVKSKDGSIRALHGRIGDYIFRTFKSGKISATYAPHLHREMIESSSSHHREQMKKLNLIIVKE